MWEVLNVLWNCKEKGNWGWDVSEKASKNWQPMKWVWRMREDLPGRGNSVFKDFEAKKKVCSVWGLECGGGGKGNGNSRK